MRLLIKRSEWIRGEGALQSYLRREHDGKKCCLGFLEEQCGLDPRLLLGLITPANVIELIVSFPATMAFLLTDDGSTNNVYEKLAEVLSRWPYRSVQHAIAHQEGFKRQLAALG